MSFKSLVLAATAAGALAAAGAAQANLITNGGFNNGDLDGAPGGFSTEGVGSTDIFGWSILSGNVDWITGYWQSADGDGYSIDLKGNTSGEIGQTINTVAGTVYKLTFSLSGNPDDFRSETRVAVIGAGGSTIGSETYSLTGANTRANMLWSTRTLSFTATGATTQIRFANGAASSGNCCWGAALDNVSVVTAVPEPATWGLMILGFGSAGAMLRRRRTVAA